MPTPNDDGLSDYQKAERAASPWLAATSRLTSGPIVGGVAGYAIDRWRDHGTHWALIIGLVVGIAAGLYGFLNTTLKMSKPKKP